jgi:hypothetical protein
MQLATCVFTCDWAYKYLRDIGHGYYWPETGNFARKSNSGPIKRSCCTGQGLNPGPTKYYNPMNCNIWNKAIPCDRSQEIRKNTNRHMERDRNIHVECLHRTTDNGQTVWIFWNFRIFSDSQESWKRCMLHQMHLFVHRFVPRILDTTKTYLQGAYGWYALQICPCKDIPEMGHMVDMRTGMHLWKAYQRNVLSCEIQTKLIKSIWSQPSQAL